MAAADAGDVASSGRIHRGIRCVLGHEDLVRIAGPAGWCRDDPPGLDDAIER